MNTETLIGRTASAKIGQNDRTATITGVSRWEKNGLVRDYVNIEGSAGRAVGKLFIAVKGSVNGGFAIDTPFGKVVGSYTDYASSGAKQHAVRELAEALFA